jgi:selenocysteine lyase/cysteine desulfurase
LEIESLEIRSLENGNSTKENEMLNKTQEKTLKTPQNESLELLSSRLPSSEKVEIKNLEKGLENNLEFQKNNLKLILETKCREKTGRSFGKKIEKSKQIQVLTQTPILTFWHKNLSSFDLAEILSLSGICLRSGSFCCQPFVQSLGVDSLLRVSLAFYNTKTEIDFLVDKLRSAIRILE